MLVVQGLRFFQLSNFQTAMTAPKSLLTHCSDVQVAYNGFHGIAARISMNLLKSGRPDAMSAGLVKSLFDSNKSSCFVLFAGSLYMPYRTDAEQLFNLSTRNLENILGCDFQPAGCL